MTSSNQSSTPESILASVRSSRPADISPRSTRNKQAEADQLKNEIDALTSQKATLIDEHNYDLEQLEAAIKLAVDQHTAAMDPLTADIAEKKDKLNKLNRDLGNPMQPSPRRDKPGTRTRTRPSSSRSVTRPAPKRKLKDRAKSSMTKKWQGFTELFTNKWTTPVIASVLVMMLIGLILYVNFEARMPNDFYQVILLVFCLGSTFVAGLLIGRFFEVSAEIKRTKAEQEAAASD